MNVYFYVHPDDLDVGLNWDFFFTRVGAPFVLDGTPCPYNRRQMTKVNTALVLLKRTEVPTSPLHMMAE